jgi:hypothetical protein
VWSVKAAAIDTVSEVDSVSSQYVIMNWTMNQLWVSIVSGLDQGTQYWFSVLVRDDDQNKALLGPASVTTLDDTTPVPGNGITVDQINAVSANILWGAATDNAPGNIAYKVVRAATPDAYRTHIYAGVNTTGVIGHY